MLKIADSSKHTPESAISANSYPGELEELQSVLHFPEEVALRITDAEYQLFYKVFRKSMTYHYSAA